jgi:SAM-dependent methyltransferase
MDVDRRYGIPDVESAELLPFDDESFDVVVCIEGFHSVREPQPGVDAGRRGLRPGGWAIVTVPLMWEYDRATFESRYTGHDLARLFEDWDDVEVVENGGRGVTWATVTGDTVDLLEQGLVRRIPAAKVTRPAFAATYLAINLIGAQIERAERRFARTTFALPMNLLVRARRR